jgi:hypothetical protein
MASPMIFPSLGSVVLNTWWLHHDGSIPCDHKVSPEGLSNGHKDRLHATHGLKWQSIIGIKDITPERQVSI